MAGSVRVACCAKRNRCEPATGELTEQQKCTKKVLLDRSGLLRSLADTCGPLQLPVCSEAYQRWIDFASPTIYSAYELVAILEVAVFMQDESTVDIVAARLADICRIEFCAQLHESASALPCSNAPQAPSATLIEISSGLDSVALARVLVHLPLYHLRNAPTCLRSAALFAHALHTPGSLCLDEQLRYDKFVDDDTTTESLLQHYIPVLRGMPSNTASLSLAGNRMQGDDVAALAGLSSNLQELTHLDLSHNDIGAEGLAILLPTLPKLQSLKLDNAGIASQHVQHVAPMLAPLTCLTALDMSNNRLQCSRLMAVLMATLLPLSQLRSLTITQSDISDKGLLQVFTSPAFHRLHHFGARDVALAVTKPRRLRRSIAALTAAAAAGTVALTSLDLPTCYQEDATTVLSAVSRLTALRSLCIACTPQLSARGGLVPQAHAVPPVPLGPCLAPLIHLRTLCVVLGPCTLPSFAASIGALTALQSLDISDSYLGNKEDAASVPAFSKLQRLTSFFVIGAVLCRESGAALRRALSQLTTLERLEVVNVTARGLSLTAPHSGIRMHEALPGLTRLHTLSLGMHHNGARVGRPDESVPIGVSALTALSCLTRLTSLEVVARSPREEDGPSAEPNSPAQAACAALRCLTGLVNLSLRGLGRRSVREPQGADRHQPHGQFMWYLPDALAKMPALQQLHLADLPLWEEHTQRFSATLAALTTLTSIDLNDCDLTDDSGPTVARELRLLPRLREVSMADNFMLPAGKNAVKSILMASVATDCDSDGVSWGAML